MKKAKNYEFYFEKFRLRLSDFNMYDDLMPHAVLDLFQDIAGTHADYIGVGFDDMIKKDLIWVLIRTKYEVLKPIPLYATVIVKTWPKKKGRLDFDREYEIYDENEELIIKGISKWVVVNNITRKISLAKDVDYKCDIYEKSNFDSCDRIADFSIDGFEMVEQETNFLDLDHNGHINNICYARYILNSIKLNENEKIKSFEINHIKEASADKIIKNYYKKDGKFIYIKGIINNDDVSYIAKIELI